MKTRIQTKRDIQLKRQNKIHNHTMDIEDPISNRDTFVNTIGEAAASAQPDLKVESTPTPTPAPNATPKATPVPASVPTPTPTGSAQPKPIKKQSKAKSASRKSTTPAVKATPPPPPPPPPQTISASTEKALVHPKFPKLGPRPTEKYNSAGDEIWCLCRKPDNGGEMMVCCEGCDEWFHFKCVNIDSKYEHLFDVYYCPYCELAGKGVIKWRKKCRLETCYKPISNGTTKYCSKEHGIEFIKKFLDLQKLNNDDDNSKNLITEFVKTSTTLNEFKEIGRELPTLPSEKIPDELLSQHKIKLQELKTQENEQISKRKLLIKVKDNLKRLNDLIQEEASTSNTSSKKKLKKIEVCGYDPVIFNHTTVPTPETISSNDTSLLKSRYDEYQNYLNAKDDDGDDEIPSPEFTICLLEKRKCIKHNGWQAIINDDIDLHLERHQRQRQKIEEIMEKKIRSFTIEHFENQA